MTQKLTIRLCENSVYAGKETIIWDTEVSGLGLRIGQQSKTFTFQYRHGGRKAKIKLGRFPNISLEKARQLSRHYWGILSEGRDPQESRQREGITIRAFSEKYLKRYAIKKRNHGNRMSGGFATE